MGLTLQSVKRLSHLYAPEKRVSGPFFRSGQSSCFHRCSGMVVERSSSVTSQSGLVWCRCSTQLSVPQENTMAYLWGPGQLPALRACFFLSQVLTAPVFSVPWYLWCVPGPWLVCWLLSLPPWQLSAFSGLLGQRSDFQIFVAFSLSAVVSWPSLFTFWSLCLF